jgi:hypothetical protein
MVQAPQKTITLDEFLQLAETKPASEYIKGASKNLCHKENTANYKADS